MDLTKWLPFLAWPRPTAAQARTELLAGMTIALMLLPQGVAYAALAGMPLVTGIYAALLPSLVAVLWGATPRLGVGPTALTSLLIAASLAGMAEPGSAHWVALAAWLSILAGGVQWLLGALRAGWIVNLVTSPVLNAFTQAAGMLILLSQVPDMLGLRSSWSALWHQPTWQHFDGLGLAFGLGGLAGLLLLKRLAPRLPAAVLVIAVCAVASWLLAYAERGGSIVGHLPAGLPHFSLPPTLRAEEWSRLLLPVLMLSLVSFLEVASSAQVEHRHAGTRWNENQDLTAQGMAKVVAGLSGSFAISGSFSRSAVTLHSGAQSGWATVLAIGMIWAAVLWFLPLLYHVPQAVLAAVVVSAVLNLIRPHKLWALWRISRIEASIAWLTCGITLATAPQLYWGVLTGVLLSLCFFLYHRLHPRIVEIAEHTDGSLRSRSIWQLPALAPGVLALRMDDDWDFASASALERTVAQALHTTPGLRALFLDAHPINRMDVTGVESFRRLRQNLRQQGIALHLAGLKLPIQSLLEHAGALHTGPDLHLYRTNALALAALRPENNVPDTGKP